MPRPQLPGFFAAHRTASHARVVATSLVVTVLLGACGTTDAGVDSDPMALGRPVADSPVKIRGVESCDSLSEMESVSGTPAREPSGEGLASFSLACLQPGPAVDLSQLRGKIVVVNLWATWCGPCREEMPILQAASEKFGDDVQFVGVLTKDSVSSAAGYLPGVGTTYPQVLDPDADLLESLRVPGLPVSVMLDPTGAKVEQQIGAFEAGDLDELLTELIAAGTPE